MTPSKIFLYFCLSFIGGIFISSIFVPHLLFLGGGLILGLILISVFWRYKNLVVIGFCILFLILGFWRYQSVELEIKNSKLINFNDLNQKITLIGIVSEEPDLREKSQKLVIKIDDIGEKVLVITYRYPEYQYGDRLKITGKLKTPPEDINGFNYKDYLKKDGIYSAMDWPEIEILEKEKGNYFYAKILFLKNKLREVINQNLSPPQSVLLSTLILGDKRQLSEDLKQKLNLSGLRHITAVSGLHVAVLTTILMSFFLGLGFWRQQAFYFTLIFIVLFIIMTGFQPSAIRAGIMAGFFIFAQYLGRQNTSSRTIIFAATFILFQNPLLLKFDIGFQLSFLAMLGIIYFLPIFQDWCKKIPNFFGLKNLLIMTFSAQIFTLPILIYNFGYFSLVSPITNILIVPFLPYIMGLGFVFSLAGIIFQPLGWILSWPVWLLLNYSTKIINCFSQIPSVNLKISWIWLIFSYLVLALLVWRLQERQKLKFLKY